MSDIERFDILDRVICAECAAVSGAMFLLGNYYCKHTKVFISVSKPAVHRKVSMLVDVEQEDFIPAISQAYGEEQLRVILKAGSREPNQVL